MRLETQAVQISKRINLIEITTTCYG